MEIIDKKIDAGKAFDWGRTSQDYARYRDIYPDIFYKKIIERGIGVPGQRILDIGTGTGVLPRNMYSYGAEWIGTDISKQQIEQAKRISAEAGKNIQYMTAATEDIEFPENSFDAITACQCFWYFDHKRTASKLAGMLKDDGRLLLLYMAWLPYEDDIAGASEKLVLRYSPNWSGAGETTKPIALPKEVLEVFKPEYHEEYELGVLFTRETWNGRMKACRGVGASLSPKELTEWEREHRLLLEKIAPEEFEVKHYAAMMELTPRK